MVSTKRRILIAFKVVAGCLAASVTLASGERVCGLSFVTNLIGACANDRGFFLPLGLLEISVTLLAIGLLLSAFRDIFADLGLIRLLGRDAESVAGTAGNEFSNN